MKKITSNSLTIKQVRAAAEKHFSKDDFMFFWDGDDLCLYFKEGVDYLKSSVFVSLIETLISELSVKFKIIDKDSKFWN